MPAPGFILPDVDRDDWLLRSSPTKDADHVPYRIRILWSRLPSLDVRLGPPIPPPEVKGNEVIRRRCDSDAIFEGRIAAMRWLIEFIGVKPSSYSDSCNASNFVGYAPFGTGTDSVFLRDVWDSCTKAASHSTHASGHTPITDAMRERVLRIVCSHLNNTIYKPLGTTVEDEALLPPARP